MNGSEQTEQIAARRRRFGSRPRSHIAAWSAKVGHEFLGALAAEGYDRVFVVRGK